MTTYTKITDYAAKDSLITGNPSKVVRGTEIDAEFTSIASADATNLKNGGALGTPASGTLTSCTGLPISTGVSGLGANVAAFLATPSSANLAAAITDETGSGANVFATSPTLVTPALGTPSSGTLTSCTGLPISTGISGLGTGIATALAVNVGTAGSPVVNGGALGTPSSGTVTNLTGTASININGTVGATTPAAGTFTTLTSTGNATLGDAEASDIHAIKGATTLLANSASAALTVTQTGSGNAFVVEDSASTDSTPFVVNASGTVGIGMTPPASAGVSSLFSLTDISMSGSSRGILGNLYYQAAWKFVDNGYGWSINDSSGAITFNLAGLNAGGAGVAATVTERMRISSNGSVGIGSSGSAAENLRIGKNLTGASTTFGVNVQSEIQSDVTASANLFTTYPTTQATAFTLSALRHFSADQGVINAGGSSVTNQFGFRAEAGLIGASSNYGFYGAIPSGANRYNFYAAGTADNYFAGAVTCNTTLTVTTSATVGGSAVVTLAASQTLTNKTLTSPTLTTPVLGTPSSGNLSSCTADGTNAVGFLHIPQNSQSAPYTLVLGDAGKHILHPSSDTTARTITIPANASVAFPIGTAVTFVNQASAGVMTIAITTDTMRLAGAGTTGSRTLAANGVATAIKLTSTEWIISGTNLT